MMTHEDLLELKQDIEEAKTKKASLESRKQLLLEQLKEKFGVSTVAAAKKKMQGMQKQISDLGEQIDVATTELESRLEETQ